MRSIRNPQNVFLSGLLLFGLLLSGSTPTVLTAQMPTDEILKNFKLSGDFVLELDGEVLKNGEIFFSERAVAYLVMAPELASPIMISPRTRAVESVHLMKVMKKDGGAAVDILADAQLSPISSFQLDGQSLVFSIDGKHARLMPKPWLLGTQTGDRLREHSPEYDHQSKLYTPGAEHIEALRGQSKDVRVKVYFGSWCPACKRMVPRVLKVADELAGSKIRFEYYGLPQPLTDDPETERSGIHGVPTAVVYVDGKMTKHLSGDDLQVPEASLRRALGG